jgi:hypothetical protein
LLGFSHINDCRPVRVLFDGRHATWAARFRRPRFVFYRLSSID